MTGVFIEECEVIHTKYDTAFCTPESVPLAMGFEEIGRGKVSQGGGRGGRKPFVCFCIFMSTIS